MPSTPRSPRKRRLAMAAAAANAAGAVAGTTAHFIGCDPDTSVSVGILVATTIGDVLKQWASDGTVVNGPVGPDRSAGTELTTPVSLTAFTAEPAADAAIPTTSGQPHRPGHPHRGYARCNRRRIPSSTVPVELPLPRAAPAGPRHAGHRQLHRGAQKFVRRAHDRAHGSLGVTGADGTA
ncbi:hypothetical protein [Streptomyces sp. NBC_00539]|uniref:hypothetical protein n=1 Tax=Streptomyces sp. NBC_00539 TaxID=2975770 RepID=UPI002E7FCDE5|nr:hypothetical protein [Streptomyces sp. NBC_00539]WUC69267.1 hypothetical protein OG861_34110 [Streptomyces sp. NBC_00539]